MIQHQSYQHPAPLFIVLLIAFKQFCTRFCQVNIAFYDVQPQRPKRILWVLLIVLSDLFECQLWALAIVKRDGAIAHGILVTRIQF
ncbi:Uncharacterised protein [Vibrio cholerae]|nr:Uncharacterised protein [Vibrio cholerae]